jgi:hypothetical protein
MLKISESTLKEIYNCLILTQLNHKVLTYQEKQDNKNKIRRLQEELELNYPLITKK